jgi:hypothetical protein
MLYDVDQYGMLGKKVNHDYFTNSSEQNPV